MHIINDNKKKCKKNFSANLTGFQNLSGLSGKLILKIKPIIF